MKAETSRPQEPEVQLEGEDSISSDVMLRYNKKPYRNQGNPKRRWPSLAPLVRGVPVILGSIASGRVVLGVATTWRRVRSSANAFG